MAPPTERPHLTGNDAVLAARWVLGDDGVLTEKRFIPKPGETGNEPQLGGDLYVAALVNPAIDLYWEDAVPLLAEIAKRTAYPENLANIPAVVKWAVVTRMMQLDERRLTGSQYAQAIQIVGNLGIYGGLHGTMVREQILPWLVGRLSFSVPEFSPTVDGWRNLLYPRIVALEAFARIAMRQGDQAAKRDAVDRINRVPAPDFRGGFWVNAYGIARCAREALIAGNMDLVVYALTQIRNPEYLVLVGNIRSESDSFALRAAMIGIIHEVSPDVWQQFLAHPAALEQVVNIIGKAESLFHRSNNWDVGWHVLEGGDNDALQTLLLIGQGVADVGLKRLIIKKISSFLRHPGWDMVAANVALSSHDSETLKDALERIASAFGTEPPVAQDPGEDASWNDRFRFVSQRSQRNRWLAKKEAIQMILSATDDPQVWALAPSHVEWERREGGSESR